MATTEGIGAAIAVDPQIEAQLKRIQGTIDGMAKAADNLAKGFSSFNSNIDSISKLGGSGNSGVHSGFEKAAAATERLKDACSEANREMEKIAALAQKLSSAKSIVLDINNSFHENSGKTFSGIDKTGREDWFVKQLEERLKQYRELYKEIEEKEKDLRAAIGHYEYGSDNYAEATAQLAEYREEMSRIKDIMKSIKEERPDFSVDTYEEDDTGAYEKYWDDRQRLMDDSAAYEKQLKDKLYRMEDDATKAKFESEKEYIEWWEDSLDEMARLGEEATRKSLADREDEIKAKRKADEAYVKWWEDTLYKKEAPIRRQEAQASGLLGKLDLAQAMPEDGIEQVKEKLAQVKSAYVSLSKAQLTNPIITDENVNSAKEKVEGLLQTLDDMTKKKSFDGLMNKFDVAKAMPEDDINQVKDKIGQLKAAYINLAKAQKDNPLITDDIIDEAEQNLERYRDMLDRMMHEQNVANKQKGVEFSLGLDNSNVDALGRKISSLRASLTELKKTVNASDDRSFISKAENELSRLEARMRVTRFNLRQTSSAASTMGDMLKRAFSFALITNFAKKVVEIRGEFEMAEKSIGIIINDANKAKSIFNDIQKIAVESPFQVKDLVKQTKQLAAYRIETDKLVETTKMLGDISAGVGVDMNRLILAFGQVKATTYLKGTELRQFSEAGVNMLGGLADRFTEIEHRAVTTGEVLQRISKRMVSFEDVNAVLQAQTSAGGAFYKMQEQQAQTLQGRISNLRDRVDIMFNEIGKQEQGIINAAISFIEFFIEHYEALQTLLTAGTIYAAVSRVVTPLIKIKGIVSDIKLGVLSFIKPVGAWTSLKQIGAVAPAIAAASAAIVGIIALIRSLTKLTRDLRRATNEAKESNDEQVQSLNRLMGKITDTNRAMEERKKALKELKEQYGNILPLMDESVESLTDNSGKQREYTEAIRETNKALLEEKLILTTLDDKENSIERKTNRLEKALRVASGTSVSGESLDKEGVLGEKFQALIPRVLEGEFTSAEDAMKTFFNELDEYYGRAAGYTTGAISATLESYQKDVETVFKQLWRWVDKTNRKSEEFSEASPYGSGGKELGKQIANFATEMDKYKASLSLDDAFKGDDAKIARQAQANAEVYVMTFKEMVNRAFNNGEISETQAKMLKKDMDKAFSNRSMSDIEKVINKKYIELNEKYSGLSMKLGSGVFKQNEGEEFDSYIKRLKTAMETAKNIVEKSKTVTYEIPLNNVFGKTAEQAQAEADALAELIPELEKYSAAMSEAAKKSADTSKVESALKSLVSEVIGAEEAFKELNDEGDELFGKKLSELAKKANVKLPSNFGADAVKDWLESIKGRLGNEEYTEALLTMNKAAAEKKMQENSEEVEKLWEKYDLSKKMEKYGFSIDGLMPSSNYYAQLETMEKNLRESGASDEIEMANSIKEKRLSIAVSEQEELAKIMYDGTVKSLSKVEQAYQTMYDNVNKIRTEYAKHGFTAEDAGAATSSIVKKQMKEVLDAEWEEFKKSEIYALAFGDLDNLSTGTIGNLKKILDEFKLSDAFNPTEMKTITKRLKEMSLQMKNIGSNNIFGGLLGGLEKLSLQIYKTGDEFGGMEENIGGLFESYYNAFNSLKEAQEAYQSNPSDQNLVNNLQQAQGAFQDSSNALGEAMGMQNTAMTSAMSAASGIIAMIDMIVHGVDSAITGLRDTAQLLNDLADSYGTDTSAGTGWGNTMQFLNTWSETTHQITSAWDSAKSGDIGGVLSGIVGSFTKWFEMYNEYKDETITELIEDEKRAVEDLENAYDQLERTLEKTVNNGTALKYHKEMIANLEEQKKAIEEMMALEESKKNTDEDELRSYKEQLTDIANAIEDAEDEWLEFMGGFSDSVSLANEWASDWLSAFRNAESGLDSLKDSFDSMWDGLVTKQLSSGISDYIEKVKNAIKDALADDGEIDEAEKANILSLKAELQEISNEWYKKAQDLGVTQTGEASEDTLQRGIESVSEQTAQALESILNSTRYYVADNNRILLAMEQSLLVGEGENTILSQVKSQTRYLKSISEIADSVYYPGSHSKGAGGIKVFVD